MFFLIYGLRLIFVDMCISDDFLLHLHESLCQISALRGPSFFLVKIHDNTKEEPMLSLNS